MRRLPISSFFVLTLLSASIALAADLPDQVFVYSKRVDMSADLHEQSRDLINVFVDTPITVNGPGFRREITRDELGVSVDRSRLTRMLQEARDPDSALLNFKEHGNKLTLPVPAYVDSDRAIAFFLKLKNEIDRPARNASYDVTTMQVTREQSGRRLDVWATVDALNALTKRANEDTELSLAVVRTEPTRKASELNGVVADTVLSEFETHYASRQKERTHNLKVAAKKIDGTVLLPGEHFDFNKAVGERNEASGFKPAPQIAGGELVDGLGGGACQIAGTLHAAAFFAGLDITERHPHSRPSFYIKLGLDAAVSYPNLNMRFTNQTENAVVIRMVVKDGLAKASIVSTDAHHRVRFIRYIKSAQPFTNKDIPDDSLPAGVRVVTQRGVPGFKVERFRIVTDLRTRQSRRQRNHDVYPPTMNITKVGTGPAAPPGYEVPSGDDHPEYRAAEYLHSDWGVGIKGFEHRQRAGKTGTVGWTEGMGTSAP